MAESGVCRGLRHEATARLLGGRRQRRTGARALLALGDIQGHHGAYVLRRDAGDAIEFIVLTLWESLEPARRFAGQDYDVAVVSA